MSYGACQGAIAKPNGWTYRPYWLLKAYLYHWWCPSLFYRHLTNRYARAQFWPLFCHLWAHCWSGTYSWRRSCWHNGLDFYLPCWYEEAEEAILENPWYSSCVFFRRNQDENSSRAWEIQRHDRLFTDMLPKRRAQCALSWYGTNLASGIPMQCRNILCVYMDHASIGKREKWIPRCCNLWWQKHGGSLRLIFLRMLTLCFFFHPPCTCSIFLYFLCATIMHKIVPINTLHSTETMKCN